MIARHCWLRFRFHVWGPWHISPQWTKGYRVCGQCGLWQRSTTPVEGFTK